MKSYSTTERLGTKSLREAMSIFCSIAFLAASFVLATPESDAQERKKTELSSVDAQLLSFWRDVAPIQRVRALDAFLPERIKIPARGATGTVLLKFYSNWAPERTVAMTQRFGQLRYPILDTAELKKQLAPSGTEFDEVAADVISSLSATDFPLVSLRRTLDVAVIRDLSSGFKDCSDDHNDCRLDEVDENFEPVRLTAAQQADQAECEREYRACADG